jgi:DNA-binding NtrC family response regulator
MNAGSWRLKRVLVIDDEPEVLQAIAEVLRLSGFEVLTCPSGNGASELISEHSIDLLITDLVMPEEDGIQLIRRVKKAHPQLKVIAMSGVFGVEVLEAARRLGASATLAKPMRVTELLDCIRGIEGAGLRG